MCACGKRKLSSAWLVSFCSFPVTDVLVALLRCHFVDTEPCRLLPSKERKMFKNRLGSRALKVVPREVHRGRRRELLRTSCSQTLVALPRTVASVLQDFLQSSTDNLWLESLSSDGDHVNLGATSQHQDGLAGSALLRYVRATISSTTTTSAIPAGTVTLGSES